MEIGGVLVLPRVRVVRADPSLHRLVVVHMIHGDHPSQAGGDLTVPRSGHLALLLRASLVRADPSHHRRAAVHMMDHGVSLLPHGVSLTVHPGRPVHLRRASLVRAGPRAAAAVEAAGDHVNQWTDLNMEEDHPNPAVGREHTLVDTLTTLSLTLVVTMLDGGADHLAPVASRVSPDREANPERVVDLDHLAPVHPETRGDRQEARGHNITVQTTSPVATMLDGTTSPVVPMLDGGAVVLRQVASPERADREANPERVVDLDHLAPVHPETRGGLTARTMA